MSDDEFAGRSLPLAFGVARGVRSFDVDKQGRLLGVSFRKAWRPGENQAECFRGQGSGGVVWQYAINASTLFGTTAPLTPKKDKHDMSSCGHGFYSYYDGSNDYRRDSRISAVIEGYGEVVIGTRGFRASKARIVALHLRPERRWWRRFLKWGYTGFATVLAGAFGAAAVMAYVAGDQRNGAINVGVALVWLAIAIIHGLKQRAKVDDGEGVSPEVAALIRRNYPDVPTFSSFAAMVHAFPPDRSLAATPESDPEFFERSA